LFNAFTEGYGSAAFSKSIESTIQSQLQSSLGVWSNGGRKGKGKLITKSGKVYTQTWSELDGANYSTTMPPKFPVSFTA
jgi:hypothetical protein